MNTLLSNIPNRADLYEIRTANFKCDIDAILNLTRGNQSILEVGSGTGRILNELAKSSVTLIVGVEINHEMCEFANKKFKQLNQLKIVNSNFLEYFSNQKFDCIIFSENTFAEFLEIDQRFEALQKAFSLLEENGQIILINFMHDFGDWHQEEKSYQFNLHSHKFGKWTCSINCKRNLMKQISICGLEYVHQSSGISVRDSYQLALLTRNELLILYHSSGLKISQEFGSYELSPLDDKSALLIHVVKKVGL